jgi:nucleoside-diphosphate-sugar epimerase
MIVLITGIHGFVGNNMVNVLRKEHTLYGLDIVSPQKDGVVKTFSWSELNLIPSVDVVIHLAGKAHDTQNKTESQVYFDINTGLTKRIFDWFLISDASKFIFFSTVKAAANRVGDKVLTEEIAPSPKGPYGESKLAAERYIIDDWEKWKKSDTSASLSAGRAKGRVGDTSASLSAGGATGRGGELIDKKVYILRPCMIHGPGNKGNLNLLFKVQQKGLPWPLGAFENKRSYCSIDNILFVTQKLVEKNIEPGVYQVADDEALSTNELIVIMAASQNKKARIWNISASIIESIAKFGSYVHLPLNSDRLKKLTESYVVSNKKIKQALGIEKMPATVEEGMKKTFESFQE